jgi:predicted nucleic acid-binding protein
LTTFVDTNVFVYARDSGQTSKQPIARHWLDHLWMSGTGRLSVQVLNEYYVTVTRKLSKVLPVDAARADVSDLRAWKPVPVSAALISAAWDVEDRFGLSFWDSLIVAAARQARCRRLLSEDLQDGQDFDGVIVVSPFTHHPGDVDDG